MKRLAGVILGLTFLATLQVRADEWSKTFKLTGKPELRVETSDANIRISTWEQDTIEAKVTTFRYKIGENGIRIEDHQEGDKVELEVRFPNHNFNFEIGSHHVDIDIHMPREGRINLRTGDGKIDVNSFKGDMELRSGDGSQEIDVLPREVSFGDRLDVQHSHQAGAGFDGDGEHRPEALLVQPRDPFPVRFQRHVWHQHGLSRLGNPAGYSLTHFHGDSAHHPLVEPVGCAERQLSAAGIEQIERANVGADG